MIREIGEKISCCSHLIVLLAFFEMHMTNAYRKSVYEEAWNKELDILDKVSRNKYH